VSLRDLAGERWIAGCLRCRQHLLASAAREGFTPDVRHSTDDYVVVQALVAAGLAVAALPGLTLLASRRPDVAVLPITDHPARTVVALLAPAAARVPAVAAAVEQLRATAARLQGELGDEAELSAPAQVQHRSVLDTSA
jgi:DNA-binding transcriptional LysR family regulator